MYSALLALLMAGGLATPDAADLPSGADSVVRADFQNRLRTAGSPPGEEEAVASIFSGHLAREESSGAGYTGPKSSRYRLDESAFGQIFSPANPFPDFVNRYIKEAQDLLYPPPGTTRQEVANGTWAFRFKELAYKQEAGRAASAELDQTTWSDAERLEVQKALNLLRTALRYAPFDRNLRHAYLDVFHDQATAEIRFAEANRVEIAKLRLGLQLPAENEFIIDREISILTNIVRQTRLALADYGTLFGDINGVNVGELDPNATRGTPLGFYIFREEQPHRNQYAARFRDDNGVLRSVPTLPGQIPGEVQPDERALANGFKDFVMVATLLANHTRAAADLARLYRLRGRVNSPGPQGEPCPSDLECAHALIDAVQNAVAAELQVILGMFNESNFPPGDVSGARAAVNGVELGLAELTRTRAFLMGTANPLGFNPDFLVLIQEIPGLPASEQKAPFDSFDSFMRWIRSTDTAPLSFARQTFERAERRYDEYQGYAEDFAEALDEIDGAYAARHVEITGFPPGDPDWAKDAKAKPGSELWTLENSLAALTNKFVSLTNSMHTLTVQRELAEQTAQFSSNRVSDVNRALIQYRGETREAWREIHGWAGTAAGAQVVADTLLAVANAPTDDTVLKGGANIAATLAIGAVNAVVQTTAAARTSQRQQEIDWAAAAYNAELAKADAGVFELQSRQEVNQLRREGIQNALEHGDALDLIAQETARKAQLMSELEVIRTHHENDLSSAAGRYFADPVHLVRAQAALLRADHAFQRAQLWVFFALRALEYKWNESFVGGGFDRGSLFKLRNVEELEGLIAAMEDFNAVRLINFDRPPRLDRISLRDDVLVKAPPGTATSDLYFDSETDEVVSKQELFRRRLTRLADPDGNVLLPFDTVAIERPSDNFFSGPRYAADGSFINLGTHLDKIEWIKVKVITANPPQIPGRGDLRYGGTTYLRSAIPPCLASDTPTSLPRAWKSFPFQYFFTQDGGNNWESRDFIRGDVPLVFAAASDGQPPSNPEVAVTFLKERSVAASEFRLTLPAGTVPLSQIEDIELWIRHFAVTITVEPICP